MVGAHFEQEPFRVVGAGSTSSGIEFRTVHLSERKRFTIKNIIDASANRKRIEVGGEEMTVAEYYKKTHNRVLR